MKRILFVILTIFIVLLGIMAVLPLFFKSQITDQVKTTLNNQIEGQIDFSDFHISLFNKFPKVEMTLSELKITGTNEFKNDTLLSVQSISSTITLSELFKSRQLKITNLLVEQPSILLKTLKSGTANWDIMGTYENRPSKPEISNEEGNDNGLGILLDNLQVSNLNFTYLDEGSEMLLKLCESELNSEGEISGNQISFDLGAAVNEIIFEYGASRYISKTSLKAESQMLFNTDKMSFSFSEGKLWLNNLLMNFAGEFAMPSDSMFFDLQLANQSKDFNDLLALVPADYQDYLKQITATGSANITGSFEGWLYNENYPAMNVEIALNDGTFKYNNLPEQIEKIKLQTNIQKPQGDLDLLTVNVTEASAYLKDNPVSLQMNISTPVSDPAYSGKLKGDIDFNTLNQAIPMEGTQLQGKLFANVLFEGKQSDLDNSAYNNFKSEGKVKLENFQFQSEQLKKPVNIQRGDVNVSTSKITIHHFYGNIGQSKFALNGQLSNYLAYFLKNETLKGNFALNSDFVNLTELATIQKPVIAKQDTLKITPLPTETDSILAFQLPDKMDLQFRSNIRKAVFDRMQIDRINGLIALKNQTLELTNLSMNMLQGKLTVNGMYKGNEQNRPDFDFNLDVNRFDVPTAYRSLSIMRKYMPIAARSTGKISTKLGLKGKMNEKLELLGYSLDGNGFFNTQNLQIIDNPTFNQLQGIIKKEKLRNVKVDDFTAKIAIDDGNLTVKPFHTVIADQEATIQGKLSVESELDFLLDFKVNRTDLGDEVNKWFAFLPGSENIKKIDVGVKVTGPINKPKTSVDLDKAKKQVQEQLKNATTKDLQDKVKKLGKELFKIFK